MDPIEGFYLEDACGNIFAVKGIMHPERRYIVVPRYVPSERGDRKGSAARYEKLPSSTYKLSFGNWPQLRYADRCLGLELLAIDKERCGENVLSYSET